MTSTDEHQARPSAVVPRALDPLRIGPGTFMLRCAQPAFGAPLSVPLNSMVILAEEPVVVDTGAPSNERWMHDLESIVDPGDVRWIVISHDDPDHTGHLAELLTRCPSATVVANWAMTERMGCELALPVDRLRWVDDGGSLDVGDRTLSFVRPPVYDSPTTRAVFDPTTKVLWASDAFATPMPADPVDEVGDLPGDMWAEGLAMFHHHALCPWLSVVDRTAYATTVRRFSEVGAELIASAHSPVIPHASVDVAMAHLGSLPDVVPPPHPDQAALEAALAGSTS